MRNSPSLRFPIAVVCCFWLLPTGCSGPNDVECPGTDTRPDDTITAQNSPQFARDYDAIDTFDVVACGTAVDADGKVNWGKECWHLKLTSGEATAAHSFLRRLLRDYPLQRSFRGIQTKYSLAHEQSIGFIERTGNGAECVFDVTVFPQPFVEIEQRTKQQPFGKDVIPVGIGGVEIPLEGSVAVDVYSFLADCAAPSDPESAQGFRLLAREAARQQSLKTMGLVLPGLLVAVVLILLLWALVQRRGSRVSSDPEVVHGGALKVETGR